MVTIHYDATVVSSHHPLAKPKRHVWPPPMSRTPFVSEHIPVFDYPWYIALLWSLNQFAQFICPACFLVSGTSPPTLSGIYCHCFWHICGHIAPECESMLSV